MLVYPKIKLLKINLSKFEQYGNVLIHLKPSVFVKTSRFQNSEKGI